MSQDYDFNAFEEALGTNWYAQDALLRKVLAHFAPEAATQHQDFLDDFGRRAAGEYRRWADTVERAENLPRIERRDARRAPVEEVILPAETRRMLAEQHGARLAGGETDDFARHAAMFLVGQNGEAGTTCSLACTDGMIRALRLLGDDARSKALLEELLSNTPDRYVHGAQFVTEVQGGSDAGTNIVLATPDPDDDGMYRLSGEKWFCSNCTADYWLITARTPGAPEGTRGVSLFVVPRLDDGAPNGYTLERLKDKLGTRALPTAEITFDGARGWMLGPEGKGIKHMVGIVLVASRVYNVVGSASLLRGAARIAGAYARFREAFGRHVGDMPLVADSLHRIERASDLALAGAFETISRWLGADPLSREFADVAVRVHISLAKAISTRSAAQHIYEAMVLPAGNGIEERFSALPRLLRDAAIYETWEGPYTLLLMQALDDLTRFEIRGRETEFLNALWPSDAAPENLRADLADILANPAATENILRFRDFAHAYHAAFEEAALARYA